MSDLSVTGNRVGAGVILPSAKNQTEIQVPANPSPVPALKNEPLAENAVEPPLNKNTRLSIQLDDETGRYVFRSIDANTGDVLMQYPTKEMLSQIAQVRKITGLTVDKGI